MFAIDSLARKPNTHSTLKRHQYLGYKLTDHAKSETFKRNRSPAAHFRPISHLNITNYGSGTSLNESGVVDEQLHIRVMPAFEVFR